MVKNGYNQATYFNLQFWAGRDGQIRVDDDMEWQENSLRVLEENLYAHKLLFDGANINDLCAIGINSSDHCRILILNKQNSSTHAGVQRAANNDKKLVTKTKLENISLTFLMLHPSHNRITACTHNIKTQQYSFLILDMIQEDKKSYPLTPSFNLSPVLDCPLSFGLTYIGRLTDWTYLGLTEQGNIVSIARQTDNSIDVQQKVVLFKGKNGTLTEDTFSYLATDNLAHRFGETAISPVNATDFVLINKEGMLFGGSFKSIFYNSEGKITIRKLSHKDYSLCNQLWLNRNKIGMLFTTADKKTVSTQKFFYGEFASNNPLKIFHQAVMSIKNENKQQKDLNNKCYNLFTFVTAFKNRFFNIYFSMHKNIMHFLAYVKFIGKVTHE